MGGTGVALGRDGAAPFNNPATIVAVDDAQLAFSVNFYTFTAFRAHNWWAPGPVDRSKLGDIGPTGATLTDLEFNALPSSLCLFLTSTQKSRLALCLASTQGNTFSFSAERYDARTADGRTTRQAQTMLESYSRFVFGPTYAVEINDRMSFGLSLHGSLVAHRAAHNAIGNTHGGAAAPVASAFYAGSRGDSAQLTAIAGLTYAFDNITAGIALESPSIHVFGVGAANRYTRFEGAGESTRTTAIDGSFISATPFRASLGAGIVGARGIAEINAHLYAPMSRAFRAELSGTTVTVEGGVAREEAVRVNLAQHANAVFDVGIGGQYFLSKTMSVLGGISTDLSAVPAGGLRADLFNYYPARSQRIALSFGAGSHGEGDELLVGTELSYAWGERIAINSYQLPPVLDQASHRTFVALFVVAGSTSFKAIKRAVQDAADVIKKPK